MGAVLQTKKMDQSYGAVVYHPQSNKITTADPGGTSVLDLVDGIFVFAKASLCGAEYGMRLCVLIKRVGDEVCPKPVNSICKANRAMRGHLSFVSFVLVNKDGVTGFPGFWCEAGSPHDNEHVYGVLDFRRKHTQKLVYMCVFHLVLEMLCYSEF